jgi:uncharacterized protein YjbJ (UPF0337 family)
MLLTLADPSSIAPIFAHRIRPGRKQPRWVSLPERKSRTSVGKRSALPPIRLAHPGRTLARASSIGTWLMGILKGTTDKAIGKVKEAVAEIIGDGKLREEGKREQRTADQEKNQSNSEETGSLNPLGNLNRLT